MSTTTAISSAGSKLKLTSALIRHAIEQGCDLADVGLLAFLIDRTWWSPDDQAWCITIAQITIGNKLGVSSDTVKRRLHSLVKRGVVRAQAQGPRESTRYQLVDPSACSGSEGTQICTLRGCKSAPSEGARLHPQRVHGCTPSHVLNTEDQKTHQQQQQQAPAPAAAAGDFSSSLHEGERVPIENIAEALIVRPRWLKDDAAWLDDRTAEKLAKALDARRTKPDVEIFRALVLAYQRRATMRNVVGWIVNELAIGMPSTQPINWPRELDHYQRRVKKQPHTDIHRWLQRTGERTDDAPTPPPTHSAPPSTTIDYRAEANAWERERMGGAGVPARLDNNNGAHHAQG
jgi:hypothetical protein